MEEDTIKEVKMTLRSLVVSSPTQMDSRQLMRDYSKLLGTNIPLARMGYRDLVTFLRERCSDSFLLSGPSSNPILTVIVPESSKHIDNFVQRSKIPSTAKVKTKRRSIHEAKVVQTNQNHIYNSFVNHNPPIIRETKEVEVKAPDIIPKSTSQNKENVDHHKNTTVTSNDVKNFLKKRTALYSSLHNLDETASEKDGAQSLFQDDDSGRHTSSSGSSTKTRQFEELQSEIMQLITAAPEGVWCTDLIRLYRERYNRELNFARFGYTSIVSLVYVLEARVQITRPDDTGDWLLTERARAAPAPPALRVRAHHAHAARADQHDPDDALPGVQFDEDVFPADCMRFSESIPALSLADCRPGAMLEVMVGEVYSPSHFWLIRLGERYNLAMEEIMDEMTLYYNGDGRGRALARGAVRVGHYCSTLYENDWHRSVIVKIIDSDTVKVRHVDYGTVESVRVSELRPLRREWGALPAQAVRARLAGLRPSAAGRRWPHAAAAHFLRRVQDKRLYANVVAVDTEHDVLETLLIDTRGADDVCVSTELIRAGHADARADSALRTAECYLYPRFEALEEGDTPNMAEIHAYLRDGIALDYVDAYRRHVPVCLPEPEPPGEHEHERYVAELASPQDTLHELYVAELASPQDTLHELYVAEPPAPPSPELGELVTHIPLLWPCVAPAPTCPTREDPASVPPAPTAPPPARTLATPVFEQTPMMPPRDSRPPEARVEPSVVSQSAINPEAQSFTPRQCYNRQPVAPRVPWPGPQGGAPGVVMLSVAECDMYRQLACVHPGAAHCYMATTLARAMGHPGAAGPQPSMGPPVGAAPWHSMGPPAGAGPWPSMGLPNGAGPWPSMGPPNGAGLWPNMGPPTGVGPRPAMGPPGHVGPRPTIGPPNGAGSWTAMGPSDGVGPGPAMGPMRWPPGFRP